MLLFDPGFKFVLKGSPEKGQGESIIQFSRAETKLENGKAEVNNIKLKSDFSYDFTSKNKEIIFNTKTDIRQINLESNGHKIKISRVTANLPFSMPYDANTPHPAGKFRINKCIVDKTYKLNMSGSSTQIKQGIIVDGRISTPDIKDFILGFNLKAYLSSLDGVNAKLDIHSKPFNFSSKNLKKFIPEQAKAIEFDLNLSSKAQIEYSSKGIQSQLKVSMNKGQIEIPDSNLSLKGISTDLEFKDILSFRSNPAQVLKIDSIKINDIAMSDAIIKYNIESKDSLFIENTQLKWCKGNVSSEAFRLPNKDNQYTLTLYCDRLELTSLLEQIGAFHAEGNGTLSGRIPVTYADGEISFDNGFLFSTPGKGGKIIVDKADMLTQGIPMDSPQFSQLDLAKEALKNYDYKWAKLNFNTSGETLLVNMQFDGKPSKQVLPFEYKKELGRFVRVGASSPGSHFQGIKLDINLKLPFNQVMKFGNKLKKAF